MLCFPKCVTFFFYSKVKRILFLTPFRAILHLKTGWISMNFSYRQVLPNIAQRKIRFSTNFSCRLVFLKWLTRYISLKQDLTKISVGLINIIVHGISLLRLVTLNRLKQSMVILYQQFSWINQLTRPPIYLSLNCFRQIFHDLFCIHLKSCLMND